MSQVRILSSRPFCGCSSLVEPQPSKLMRRVRFPSPAPDILRPRILFLAVFLYGERACLLFIEHAPWSSVPRSLRKYRIHSVGGENGVNLLFLVSLILFRDMHEEIDCRIFDPPPPHFCDKRNEGGRFVLVRDLPSNGSMRLNSYLDFGRWTVNSVPWPTVLSTSIEPLPRSIAWRTSDKPNPVPPTSRLLALFTR